MTLAAIESVLRDGARLRGFRAGAGCRVIRVSQGERLLGYGEHPHVETALAHADEDIRHGGREFHEVYGRLYPHYLTGAAEASSALDAAILRGDTLDVWHEHGDVVATVSGWGRTIYPEMMITRVIRTGEPETWMSRGFTYLSRPAGFPNGDPCVYTVVSALSDHDPRRDPWMWRTLQTGRGHDFESAVFAALIADPVEVMKSEPGSQER